MIVAKEKIDQEIPSENLLLSTKKEQYKIGRLEQIQNFTQI